MSYQFNLYFRTEVFTAGTSFYMDRKRKSISHKICKQNHKELPDY